MNIKVERFFNNNYIYGPIFWVGIAILLLIPTLFFPISADLSIYLMGGEAVLQDKKLYTDFIDIKPPIFYYTFALLVKLFGRSEIGIRVFDIILQSITIFLIFKTIDIGTKNRIFAGCAAVLYSVIYTTLGYSQTLQGEALITPLIMGILYFQLSTKRSIFRYIASGIMIGFAIGIKYPLGIILLFVIFDDLLSRKMSLKKILFKDFIISATALVVFVLSLASLLDKDVFNGFMLITDLVAKYSARPALDGQYLVFSLNKIAMFLGDNISFLVTGSVLVTIFLLITRKIEDEKTYQLLSKTLLFALLFAISIFVERKFHEYYFVRMLPLWVILASYSITYLFKEIRLNYSKYDNISKFIVIVILALSFYFSPALRYVFRAKTAVSYVVNREKYNLESEKFALASYRVQWLDVSNYLNKKLHNYDYPPFLLNIQTGSAPINYFTPKFVHSAFQQSQFYFSIEAPKHWQDMFLKELKHADFLCIETDDNHSTITGHTFSSSSYIFEQKGNTFAEGIKKYISNNFEMVHQAPDFNVYERSDNRTQNSYNVK
jgi:4-amino-4-deoxy-L-arabinose transferase-like glycosyltransferase